MDPLLFTLVDALDLGVEVVPNLIQKLCFSGLQAGNQVVKILLGLIYHRFSVFLQGEFGVPNVQQH